MFDRYYSKNTGAVCYLICQGLLSLESDLEVTENSDGFVVVSFIPTDERMDSFRYYIDCFKNRQPLNVNIVEYNSTFSAIKKMIDFYKIGRRIK